MTPAARIQTSSELLDSILAGDPAEKVLTAWARSNRFAGSKDRAAVRDNVYDALRRKRSLAVIGGDMTGRGLMIGLTREQGDDLDMVFSGLGYGPAPLTDQERASGGVPESDGDRYDLPDWLLPALESNLGETFAATAEILKARAPVVLRANLRKTDRNGARKALADDDIETRDHPLSDTAIEVLTHPRRVAQSEAYRLGLVEIQDASSQAAIDTLDLHDGFRVLDYCAGGGGKLLAIGGRVDGAFFAHDINEKRMADLPARADRAGLKIQVLDKAGAGRQAPYDLVFCDAPCSGSGTWRRTPDAKWRLTPDRLAELNTVQDQILDEAAHLVSRQGVLAYATCSLLRCENQDRIDAFLARHSGWTCRFVRNWDLTDGGDGFFVAHLTQDL